MYDRLPRKASEWLRGERLAWLAGARTAQAIVPAIEADDRYSAAAAIYARGQHPDEGQPAPRLDCDDVLLDGTQRRPNADGSATREVSLSALTASARRACASRPRLGVRDFSISRGGVHWELDPSDRNRSPIVNGN